MIEFENTPKLIPVIDAMPADLLTPLGVYLKLAGSGTESFLLESVEGGESLGRYSFIGADPMMIVGGNRYSTRVRAGSSDTILDQPMFETLRSHFSGSDVDRSEGLPPFIGGAIGYLGFNCSGWFEKSVAGMDEGPDAEFMFFHTTIAFDHAKQIISIISLVPSSNDNQRDAAVKRNATIRQRLESGPVYSLPAHKPIVGDETVNSNFAKDEFETAVREIKELIREGECYQVVLSQCFSRRTNADPVSIYRAMRSLNPSPYMFLLRMGERSLIGASPEMLVKCSGRNLEYRPIAGTRRRGNTAEEDARLADEMRADKKEVAEHLMLVDLGRNDLGRVAEFGTVRVEELMGVEKYSHVQHLVSRLSARLRSGLDRFDALAACFPAGTVSGAPKVRAMEIIKELEPTARGVYAGAVGYFDYGRNMDMCIAIRTLVLSNGVATVQAGAGIVADSVPEDEFEESVNKARALLKAVEIAETHRL